MTSISYGTVDTITCDDLVSTHHNLTMSKEEIVKGIFKLFPEAEYLSGDKVVVNSEFYKDFRVPTCASDRVVPSRYIKYSDYFIIRSSKQKQVDLNTQGIYGLTLNNNSVVMSTCV